MDDPALLSCREVVELVTAYLDGALPEDTRRQVAAHLDDCDGCTAYVEQLRTTVAVVARLGDEHACGHGCERLVRAFRGWRDHPGDLR